VDSIVNFSIAFYDVLADDKNAKQALGDKTLQVRTSWELNKILLSSVELLTFLKIAPKNNKKSIVSHKQGAVKTFFESYLVSIA